MVAVAMIFGQLQAQAPYKHGIGGVVGSFNGFTYKTFFTDHLALSVDLGNSFIVTAGEYYKWVGGLSLYTLQLNPNLMYQGNFVAGLYGLVGGGVSLGWNWGPYRYIDEPRVGRRDIRQIGKFGVNAILGLEYKFNIPLALQLDFRPGYGLLFSDDKDATWNHFDWNLSLSVRYAF
ncbi:MAG: hypothetical protein J5719_05440 [Bacteroidales bacterium]|nr:hypothetical protein [Bacteroidales bacterium]